MKIKFPLKLEHMYWKPPLKKERCSLCGCRPPDGVFVVMNGGALLGTKDNASMSDKLIGFLSILLHDHSNISNMRGINLVDASPDGQFEFHFCSSKCLRKFLNLLVDQFEKGMK